MISGLGVQILLPSFWFKIVLFLDQISLIIAKYVVPSRGMSFVESSIVEVSKNKVALWIVSVSCVKWEIIAMM